MLLTSGMVEPFEESLHIPWITPISSDMRPDFMAATQAIPLPSPLQESRLQASPQLLDNLHTLSTQSNPGGEGAADAGLIGQAQGTSSFRETVGSIESSATLFRKEVLRAPETLDEGIRQKILANVPDMKTSKSSNAR